MIAWFRRIALGLVALVIAAFLILWIGSKIGLDYDRAHSAATAKLPVVLTNSPDGLVRIPAGGMEFRARVAGLSNTGPAILMLHGFPETSAMWKPLIDRAAGLGYRVVAFDQRGYSPGARPTEVEDYILTEMVQDVVNVADAVGFENFHLVGHDWGAVVGWLTTASHPERIRSWSALSIPHSGVFIQSMKEDLPAYIDVFNIPVLADAIFTFNGLMLLESGNFSVLSEGDEYRAVLSEPGALRAAIHWYRALRPSIVAAGDIPLEIRPPTLFIGGSQDPWSTRPERARQADLIKGPFTEMDLEAGHYLMDEQPEVVMEAILAHLAGAEAQPTMGSLP